MDSGLRRCGAALVLLGPLIAGCQSPGTAAGSGHRQDVPAPDMCKLVDRTAIGAVFRGKVTGCEQSSRPGTYSVTFSGRSVLSGRKRPATLVIGVTLRHNQENGADRWDTLGRTGGERVSMIGVGESSVFEPEATSGPQLSAVSKGLIVSITVRIQGAAVPQDKLPDHLMRIGQDAVGALG